MLARYSCAILLHDNNNIRTRPCKAQLFRGYLLLALLLHSELLLAVAGRLLAAPARLVVIVVIAGLDVVVPIEVYSDLSLPGPLIGAGTAR